MLPPCTPNDYAPMAFPGTAQECWELGRKVYSDWNHKRAEMKALMNEFNSLAFRAQDICRTVECQTTEETPALRQEYGEVMKRYVVVKDQIERQNYLEDSMGRLGRHMQRQGMIRKGDIPTFPLNF